MVRHLETFFWERFITYAVQSFVRSLRWKKKHFALFFLLKTVLWFVKVLMFSLIRDKRDQWHNFLMTILFPDLENWCYIISFKIFLAYFSCPAEIFPPALHQIYSSLLKNIFSYIYIYILHLSLLFITISCTNWMLL